MARLRLLIERDGKPVFETDGEMTLAPLDQGERSKLFYFLSEALATLAGVTPQHQIPATEEETGRHRETSGRYHQAHSHAKIVHLQERLDSRVAKPRSE
jgi:hypothetical protein